VKKSGRLEIGWTSTGPEGHNKSLVGTTQIRVWDILLVYPVLGVLVKEDSEIRHVTEALQCCIKIAGISEICQADVTLLRILGSHLVPSIRKTGHSFFLLAL